MYEPEIAAAAEKLASRWAYNDATRGFYLKPPRKEDRQFNVRLGELVDLLADLGFNGWQTGTVQIIQNQHWGQAKAMLMGVEVATGNPVELWLYNHRSRISPKNLTFHLKYPGAKTVVIGVHIGTLRATDLRTRETHYDDVVWAERHFRGQLEADKMAGNLTMQPEGTLRQLATATKELEKLGITDCRHAMLPKPDQGESEVVMTPYLVGMYGAMPCAIYMTYKNSNDLTLQFYLVNGAGLLTLKFGELQINAAGEVSESAVDISALLKRAV